MDIRWAANAATDITLRTGHAGPSTVRSPLFDGSARLVDTTTGQPVEYERDGDQITFAARADPEYRATQA